MRKELIALRQKMQENGFDAYIIPTTDFHRSEYVHDHFKCREYISGFTGSAGTLLVTTEEALLWTDGRYFLQAENQLKGSGIKLMKMGQPDVPTMIEYLESIMTEDHILAFDGRLCSPSDIPEDMFTMVTDADLVGEIWRERPAINPSEIYPLDLSVTGESSESKLARLRAAMAEKGADFHIITALDEIAWLYNLRGSDVKHTPVFFAYALITAGEDFLYTMKEDLHAPGNHLPYEQFMTDIEALPPGTVLLDKSTTGYAIIDALPEHLEIISAEDPVLEMKAIKNQAEISATKNAHIKDGVAMVSFIHWLKQNGEGLTEIDASDKLEDFRKSREGFTDLSFDTISGYAGNGAIIHYSATEDTNKTLKSEGLYLVDSGGQYEDGTTDITRTIAMGPLTDNMKLHYTAVLKSHIALCTAKFTPGTTGAELDAIARKPLLEIGLNYNHGTGHGVGHLLGCHEGPQSISPRDTTHPILPGMINSCEPGVYIEGSHGIRLENELLCIETDSGLYGFEPITFCPFDRDAIVAENLTKDELAWLNFYHAKVFETIGPLVDGEIKKWLQEATKEII